MVARIVDFAITLGLLSYDGVVRIGSVAELVALPLFVSVDWPASRHWDFLSALNVRYRDFRYIVPFIVQFGLFVSPVAFTSAVLPEQWRSCIPSIRWWE